MKKILGLDLGTSSIGWAVIEETLGGAGIILGAGVRIFEPPVDSKTETPKNRERRQKRGARRVIARRRMRKVLLASELTEHGLLPSNESERSQALQEGDPYELRSRGLDEALTPHQFSRVLFHICKRRGFKSNRKSDRGEDKKKEKSETLAAIAELGRHVEETGCRTLGEYLFKHCPDRKRNRHGMHDFHTARAMFEAEFNLLWEKQKKHIPALTDALKTKIHRAIFHQRPLKIQKHLIGLCQFEQWPAKDKKSRDIIAGKRRAPKAHPLAQRFRFLQDINNMAVNVLSLTSEQKKRLAAAGIGKEKLTWAAVRKALGLSKTDLINFEQAGKKHLLAARTEASLAKALDDKWECLPADDREALFTALNTISDDEALLTHLQKRFGFTAEEAQKVAQVELEQGYAGLSLRAIKKLLPHMEEGLTYPEAVKKVYADKEREALPYLPPPPMVRNPSVMKTLHETHKVVNALIRKFGKPDVVRVELAREMKQTAEQKSKINKDQRQREGEAVEIKESLRNDPFRVTRPSRADVEKFRLWKESKERCAYCGDTIPATALFHEAEVDHIIPFSRSFDDSYMNKVVCHTACNRDKGNMTPWEWRGESAYWEQIESAIRELPWPKRRRFLEKNVTPETAMENYTAPLNDTKYASKEAKAYLQRLGISSQAGKGMLTAMLRRFWGLNSILRTEDAPETDKTKRKKSKNRGDHRHHAIDAIVIALTEPRIVQLLTRVHLSEGRLRMDDFPAPWDGFRDEVAARVADIVVSHRVSKKISGALHKDTSYGATGAKDEVVSRKKVDGLTPGEVERIRDERIKKLVQEKIAEHGDLKKVAKAGIFLPNKNGDPVPVRSVRLTDTMTFTTLFPIRDAVGDPYRYVTYGNNHHMEIVRHKITGKVEGKVVTMMEAARRARRGKEAIVQRDHGPDYDFIMSLARNETVLLTLDGAQEYYQIQTMNAVNKQIALRRHTCADINNNGGNNRVLKIPSALFQMELPPQKIIVSPIGEVFPAND